ncbi:MAG: hypothetical protein K0S33_2053 [Bacteroidetes bacterium]|jgi:hypothetical protein|nr:hypothetical protein [Bacteroidota bacterium]
MKTKNNNQKTNRIILITCLFLLALTTPVFSQEAPETEPTSYFDYGMILSVLCVVALATFMFVAMFKAKTKETREHKHRHRLHIHRKQAHIDHFKF